MSKTVKCPICQSPEIFPTVYHDIALRLCQSCGHKFYLPEGERQLENEKNPSQSGGVFSSPQDRPAWPSQ